MAIAFPEFSCTDRLGKFLDSPMSGQSGLEVSITEGSAKDSPR